MPSNTPLSDVFMDIEINGMSVGRIIFRLFDDVCPRTCRNFRELATGEHGFGYEKSTFHRVADFMIQGGDWENNDGTGGQSIWRRYFTDESFRIRHDRPGLLASANYGPDSNGSQFYITAIPCPWLDGRNVVFGEVISGMEVVNRIQSYVSDHIARRPSATVVIAGSGVVLSSTGVGVGAGGDDNVRRRR